MDLQQMNDTVDNVGYANDWYTKNKRSEWHDLNSITLAELIDMGLFDWDTPILNWRNAAYDDKQFDRICKMFVDRYYWREIGIVPPLKWLQRLSHGIRNEVMPKYLPLYAKVDEGVDWFADSDEYGKRRDIDSGFPETMLSGSEVYASNGKDSEFETVKDGSSLDKLRQYEREFKSVDVMVLDELEPLFSSLWSSNVNGW